MKHFGAHRAPLQRASRGFHTDPLGESDFWSDRIGSSDRLWDSDGPIRSDRQSETPQIGEGVRQPVSGRVWRPTDREVRQLTDSSAAFRPVCEASIGRCHVPEKSRRGGQNAGSTSLTALPSAPLRDAERSRSVSDGRRALTSAGARCSNRAGHRSTACWIRKTTSHSQAFSGRSRCLAAGQASSRCTNAGSCVERAALVEPSANRI
jgi:hypothetical protein